MAGPQHDWGSLSALITLYGFSASRPPPRDDLANLRRMPNRRRGDSIESAFPKNPPSSTTSSRAGQHGHISTPAPGSSWMSRFRLPISNQVPESDPISPCAIMGHSCDTGGTTGSEKTHEHALGFPASTSDKYQTGVSWRRVLRSDLGPSFSGPNMAHDCHHTFTNLAAPHHRCPPLFTFRTAAETHPEAAPGE